MYRSEIMLEKSSLDDVSGIALFIDVENFVGLCSRLAVPTMLKPICEKLKEFGPLRYRRAYGDINKAVKSTGGDGEHDRFFEERLDAQYGNDRRHSVYRGTQK